MQTNSDLINYTSAILFLQPPAGFNANHESYDYSKARGFQDITAEAGASTEL